MFAAPEMVKASRSGPDAKPGLAAKRKSHCYVLWQWGVNSHITHMWNHLRDLLMTLFKAPKTTNDNFLSFFQVEEEMIFPPKRLAIIPHYS